MSKSGFSLLVGWLTEGMGGEASGSGEGFSGEKGKRGRAAIMRVVNNHLRFDGAYKLLSYERSEIYILNNIHNYTLQLLPAARRRFLRMLGRSQMV